MSLVSSLKFRSAKDQLKNFDDMLHTDVQVKY